MPYLLTEAMSGLCAHGGSARPVAGVPRVKVDGSPVLTAVAQLTVSGCANVVGTAPFPCVLGMAPVGATRVKVLGVPVLLSSSQVTNLPTAAATSITQTQTRVKGL